MFFALLFSCTADWIDPNDFSLTYKYSESTDTPNGSSNSDNSNQGVSESSEGTQTEENPTNNPSDEPSTEESAEEEIEQEESEQEESEQEESEQEEEPEQPSNEPSTEQEPADEHAVEYLLLDGTWSISDPVIVSENCNVNAWSSIVDIYDLIPSEFEVTNTSDTGFSMNLLGASLSCFVENEVFLCDTYETEIPVPSFDASGEVLFLYGGVLYSASSLTMTLEIDIYNCTGNDCPILAFLVPYPCQITMESDAEFIQ